MNDKETVELAQRLVRINSVNPNLVPGAPGESELARFVADFLDSYGIATELKEALPGRPNVVSRIPGTGNAPTLLLCCHLDTVSVEGMEQPFSGRIEAGRLYGRGAQDVKGGLTSMLSAASILSKHPPKGDVIIAGVVDEEAYSAGTESLLTQDLSVDMAVVFEPSDLDVVVAHKGFGWLRIVTKGVAAHGSKPKEGVDAIVHMGQVLTAIDRHSTFLSQQKPHPRLGERSIHASLIRGGRELSSYPDHCSLDIERRTLPGESGNEIHTEVQQILNNLAYDTQFQAELELSFFRPAFEISESENLPQKMSESVTRQTGSCNFVGMSAWTDAALFRKSGIPAIVFGPGGAGLHGIDEYGDTDQICHCRDILVDFAQSF